MPVREDLMRMRASAPTGGGVWPDFRTSTESLKLRTGVQLFLLIKGVGVEVSKAECFRKPEEGTVSSSMDAQNP